MKRLSVIGHFGLGLLTALAFAAGAEQTRAQSPPPQIAGTTRQLTTDPADQFDPAISGNIVCYTDMRSGNANVWYYDLATGTEHQVTSSTSDQMLCDVFGNTIAYVDQSPFTGGGDIKGFTIGGSLFDIAVGPSAQTEPGIAGSLVAWQDNRNGNFEIYAKDLTTGVEKRLTTNSNAISATPNVSGRLVAYSMQDAFTGSTQVFVTNYDTVATTQLTTIGNSSFPDISGTRVVYQGTRPTGDQDIFVFDLTTMAETRVSLPGMQRNPHISGDWVSIEDVTSTGVSSILVYHVPSGNVFTAVRGTSLTNSAYLNDIDGNRIAYTSNAAGNQDIYVFEFTPPTSDFSLSSIPSITVSVAGSASSSVTVNSVSGSSPTVELSVSGQPAGVLASLGPTIVTPPSGSSATSTLAVSLGPSVTPSSFTLTITGSSGTLTHSTTANVTVKADSSSITNVIGNLLGAGCIDNAGIGNALDSKLSAAQASSGNVQTAINILTAFKNQVQAQGGKHIATSCTIGGVTFNPVTTLLVDVQGFIDSLRVGTLADPIMGYVVDANGAGIAGATLSILDSSGNPVASSTTDITGFYFFATTGVLTPGSAYTVQVVGFPAGFRTSTPAASPQFTWQGTVMTIGNFVLN